MSKSDAYYVEEFLYRGRPAGDARTSGWHLIVGLNGLDPAGRPHPPLPIMTSEQAIAEGWSLPTVLSEINQDLMAEIEELRRNSARFTAEIDGLQMKNTELERLSGTLGRSLNEAKDYILSLESKVGEFNATPK